MPMDAAFIDPPTNHRQPRLPRWNLACLKCHVTKPVPAVEDAEMDTTVTEFGIACEACHGPGEAPVAANQNPLRRYEKHPAGDDVADATIVNPLRSDPTRSSDVCGQCHGITEIKQESLDDLLREGEIEGVGAASERAIIGSVVEFGATTVREVMTPRSEIVAVERSAPADQVARVVAQSKFSRLPVYEGTLDRVLGMLTSWDVIANPEAPFRAPRPVGFAAPDERCQVLLTRMLRERRHLAIVRAATGETLGLVTLEDLVEEIIGDIHDEHDDPATDR